MFILYLSLLISFGSLKAQETTTTNQTLKHEIVWCNGQMCMDNCTAMACRLCNPTSCNSGSNCHCASTSIPGGLSLEKTPQFVLLTLEGPIKRQFFTISNITEKVLKNPNITDSKGCFIKPSYYVQNDYSDYNYAAYIGLIGMLGINSITGKVNQGSTSMHWEIEYLNGKQMIYNYSKTTSEIISSRAANGQFCQTYFNSIEGINIKIDSSLAENPFLNVTYNQDREKAERIWPYTLDYGFHSQKLCVNKTLKDINCINKTYKGMWEFVQTVLRDELGNTYDLDWVCEENYTAALNILKTNFDDNYQKNRAPFNLNISQLWLLNEAKVYEIRLKFLQEAFSYMGNKNNVLFATEDRVLQWLKNPISYSETIKMHEFDCINKNLKDAYWREPLLCDYPTTVGAFYFNNVTCPEYYPNITNLICDKDQVCHKGIDDCNCESCEKCVNNWPGDVYWNFTKEWEDGVCGRIIIANHFSWTARSAIITLRLYNSYIYSIWGGNYMRINATNFPCKSETWRIVPYLREYLVDTTYSYVGICIHKGADFQRNLVRLGVEFASSYPLASKIQDWVVRTCGNGVCSDDELGINNKSLTCAADCLPTEIYSFLFATRVQTQIFFMVLLFLIVVFLNEK